MHVVINQGDLVEICSYALNTAAKQDIDTVVSCAILSAKGNTLTLKASNYDVSIVASRPAEIEEEGLSVVRLSVLLGLTKGLPKRKLVTLKALKNYWTEVKCGRSRYKVPGIPYEDFPVQFEEKIREEPIFDFKVNSDDFLKAVNKVQFFMGDDPTRPVANGISVSPIGNRISLTAVNFSGMAYATVPDCRMPKEAQSFMIHRNAVADLILALKDNGGDICIKKLKNAVLIQAETWKMLVKEIELDFPDCTRALVKPPIRMSVNRKNLLESLKRLSLLVLADKGVKVKVTSKKRMGISLAHGGGTGVEAVKIHAIVTDADSFKTEVNINPKLLLDVIRRTKDEFIDLYLGSEMTPVNFRKGRDVYVLMPLVVR